jgi:hypothetical protein
LVCVLKTQRGIQVDVHLSNSGVSPPKVLTCFDF